MWGSVPEIYWASNRRPATRFVTTSGFLADVNPGRPGTDADPKDVDPIMWQYFYEDLAQHPPRYVIDTSSGTDPRRAVRTDRRVPEAAEVHGRGLPLRPLDRQDRHLRTPVGAHLKAPFAGVDDRRMPGSHRTGSLLVTASVVLALLIAALPGVAGAATADDSVAQAGVVLATDLGPGWTETPAQRSVTSPLTHVRCSGMQEGPGDLRPVRRPPPGYHDSNFECPSQRGPVQLVNEVTVFPSMRAAKRAIERISSPALRSCIKRTELRAFSKARAPRTRAGRSVLKSRLASSVTSKTANLSGDDKAGLALTISGRPEGGRRTGFTLAVAFARVGRALSEFNIVTVGSTGTVHAGQAHAVDPAAPGGARGLSSLSSDPRPPSMTDECRVRVARARSGPSRSSPSPPRPSFPCSQGRRLRAPPSSAADQTAAQAGVVVATDLGPGWTETPHKPSDSSDAQLKKYASCRRLGKTVTLLANKGKKFAEAQSPNFEQAGIKFNNSTIVLNDVQTATSAMTSLSSPTFANCLRDIGKVALAKLKKNPKIASQIASTSVDVSPASLSLPSDQEAALVTVMTLHTKTGLAVHSGFVFDFVRMGHALDGISVEYSPSRDAAAPRIAPRALAPAPADGAGRSAGGRVTKNGRGMASRRRRAPWPWPCSRSPAPRLGSPPRRAPAQLRVQPTRQLRKRDWSSRPTSARGGPRRRTTGPTVPPRCS